jgi:mannose-6-phosphate isomerase-like protein (cupin superfamily)
MSDGAASLSPIVLDERDVARDGWDDPLRGRLHWRTLFSQGSTPTQGITCGVAELAPGDRLERHRHAPPEVYYVVAGEGIVFLDGKEIALKPGAAVYIPGMAEHGVRQTGAAPLRFFYVFPVDSFDGVEYLFSTPPAPRAAANPE